MVQVFRVGDGANDDERHALSAVILIVEVEDVIFSDFVEVFWVSCDGLAGRAVKRFDEEIFFVDEFSVVIVIGEYFFTNDVSLGRNASEFGPEQCVA